MATPAERVEEFTAGVDEACIVTAHTHMQYDRRVGETTAAQPGQCRLAVRARARERLLGAARAGGRAPPHAVRPRRGDRADAGSGHAEVRADRGADAHTAAAGRGDRARRATCLLRLDSRDESDRRREAGGREGNAARPLRCRRLSCLPAGPLLLGRAARSRTPGREGPSAPHLARHLADRAGVVGLATRLRDTAFKRTLAELEVGDEVEVEEPKGSFLLPEDTERRLRLHRGRNRDHRLSLDAALHRRQGAAVPRHARLLESRPRVGGLPRRARGARAADRRVAA